MTYDELADRMGSVELTMQFGAAAHRAKEFDRRDNARVHETREL